MKKPDPKPRKNPAGKASKPKASTGEGTKRKAPTQKRAPTKSAESLPEWSEERLFRRILFDFSSDLRRAFNTIDLVIRLLSKRQRIQYTDEQHLNLKSLLMGVGQAGWEERFSTDPHHWGFLTLSHCIKVGYPIPAELKAHFEGYGEKLAEIMRLFVREVDPAKLTSDVAELYADKGGAFYKKSKKLGGRNKGNPPPPMVQFFTCAVIVPRLADEIESAGAQAKELMNCEEDWEDLEFETLWREVLEPYGREQWDGFVDEYRTKFIEDNTQKGHQTKWGWTKGNWREAVKKALHKYLVSIHSSGVDLSKVCFGRMKAPGNNTPAQD